MLDFFLSYFLGVKSAFLYLPLMAHHATGFLNPDFAPFVMIAIV